MATTTELSPIDVQVKKTENADGAFLTAGFEIYGGTSPNNDRVSNGIKQVLETVSNMCAICRSRQMDHIGHVYCAPSNPSAQVTSQGKGLYTVFLCLGAESNNILALNTMHPSVPCINRIHLSA